MGLMAVLDEDGEVAYTLWTTDFDIGTRAEANRLPWRLLDRRILDSWEIIYLGQCDEWERALHPAWLL
jgi:hypothetical protein